MSLLFISLPRWMSYNLLFPRMTEWGFLHLESIIDPEISCLTSSDFHSWGSPEYEDGEVWEFRILLTRVSHSKAKQIMYLPHYSLMYFDSNPSHEREEKKFAGTQRSRQYGGGMLRLDRKNQITSPPYTGVVEPRFSIGSHGSYAYCKTWRKCDSFSELDWKVPS